MHRQETTAELDHLRTTDGGLQPGTVMERSIPVIDWRVIPAERDLQMIILFKPNNAPLDFHIEPARGRRSQTRIGSCGKAQFTKKSDSRGQSGTEVKDELPLVEPAMAPFQGRRGKIDIAKTSNM